MDNKSFMFEIEEKEKYIVSKLYKPTKIPTQILYHKIFIENANNTSSGYVIKEQIGKGGASVVYKGVIKDTDETIIIKELKTNNLYKVKREVNILKLCKNIPNVIQLLDFFVNDDCYYLLFPYYNCNSSRTIFYNFTSVEIKIFMKKFLEALEKLHKKGIIHRDLKPGNILVKSCSDFYIIDFGISDFYIPHRKFDTKLGTRNFKAPEQLINIKGFDYGIDIWSSGLIFSEIYFGRYPFWKPEEDIIILENIYNLVGSDKFNEFINEYKTGGVYHFLKNRVEPANLESYFERKASDSIRNNTEENKKAFDLIGKMLEIDPRKRITAHEALKHPYFAN